MPRPPIERAVSGVPRVTLFKPAGVPTRELEQLQLGVDELEAIRLVDLEGLSHEQAAEVMGVSRQTVGRVLERGRGRVAEALVGGKAILIGGGQYRVEPRRMRCFACQARWVEQGEDAATVCPECGARDVGICWGAGERCGDGRGRRGGGPGRGAGKGHGPGCDKGHGPGCGQGRGPHGRGATT
ncbi:MAG TPA: DUF134 domain-containing protein [Thermoleophilia bacterium]|jgi:predicted DNA-binding protein (UPF0251 family)|nr:DUF134 domain-containing protein [Thermoleophilia bacterium]